MTPRNAGPLPQKDGISYGEIYGALRRAADEGRFSPAPAVTAGEAGPPRWDHPALVTMFRRLGTVPSSYTPKRAALRVVLAATEMAGAHRTALEQVYATLLAFCSPAEQGAICAEPPRCAECPINSYCRHASRRPTIKELPETERPRERLLSRGPEQMTDAELLAILIGGGSQQESALALGQRLLGTFGSLQRLWRASNRELQSIKGIGKAKAAQIRAGLALGRRLAAEPIAPRVAVRGSEQAFRHFHERMKDLKKETFVCLLLDTKHNVIREEQIAVGSLNESLVHPREVFQPAIAESAACVLFVHNHPSGDPKPSPQDRQLTRRLCEAGRLVGITVLDHIIVGRDAYYSFAEQGEMPR